MRDDMDKIVVERPRMRRGDTAARGDARIWRNSEERPHKVGIKRGYSETKWLNENLAPLQRFLRSQIGRPWDKVYAELCQGIDRRNTVQAHIFTHIEQFVVIQTVLRDGVVEAKFPVWPNGTTLANAFSAEMFVHPRTGILLENRARRIAKAKRNQAKVRARAEDAATHKDLGDDKLALLLENLWFEVQFAPLPEPEQIAVPATPTELAKLRLYYPRVYDCVLRKMVSGEQKSGLTLYGKYAVSKRQMSAKEVARLGLVVPVVH